MCERAPGSRRLRSAALTLVLVASGAAATAWARKPPRPPPTPSLTLDQQTVLAQVVNDTFRSSRAQPGPFTLCLDVQTTDVSPDDEPPPEPEAASKLKSKSKSRHPFARPRPHAPPPPLPVVRGAPPELLARLTRPWRTVVSATTCRLDPRQPFTLGDAKHTPAQLVTLRLLAQVATGTIRVEWTGASATDPHASSSRDCTSARATGPSAWAVTCGGTWYE
jgi:hypothetical protein